MPKLVDPEDKILGDLTPGTSDQQAPVPVSQPPMPPVATTQNLAAGVPQSPVPSAPAAPPSPAPAAPPMRLPGMPPNVNTDEISNYLSQQKGSLDKFGADKQMELENQLMNERNSLSSRATSGLKGFGDAIMQGVARAGNPGWQSQYENRQDEIAKERLGTLQHANQSNMESSQMKMGMDKMDPNSVLSKESQASYAPLFQKLGYPHNAMQGMSAANIDNALSLMTAYGGKEVEALIKKYEMDLESRKIDATLKNIESESENRTKERQFEALSQFEKMPWYSRILHPGISHELENKSGMNEPASASSHPQASEALSWAQNNPNDPRSADILKRLGK